MNNITQRILAFVSGLFIMAFGVALSVKANLGVSPISCIPYIYSLRYPLTMGEVTIIFNVFLILLQILLLRRKYRLFQLIQLPVVFVFGFFTDFTLYLVSDLTLTGYAWQGLLCLLSCVVIAFGVFLEVKAGITYLPGEGLAMGIAETWNKEFGKAKIWVDSSMVIVGILSSFALIHHLQGVREGTIVAALLVGYLARLYSRKLPFFDVWLGNKPQEKEKSVTPVQVPNKKLIITISREYGSGGHEIGQMIAKELGFSFYDKELIQLTTEQSGFTTQYIEEHEQKLAHSLLYDLYEQNYAYLNEQQPPLDALFLVQSKIIRELCEKESCVIVGRCANFVLKDHPDCFTVFIHAGNEYRKNKIVEEYDLDARVTDQLLEKADRGRANYCNHFTGKNWNNANNYHLTIDSSYYGSEKVARMIIEAVREKIPKK
ncbi:cytidylate kinase family protein [Labilibaculum sp. K2S]|uniref:cytidylate kinase family protein n=1 Tax=Labilibaculum sp. K2S TaxID=3056386 RepID=UPI0025A3F434|nr:cytidylate kinase family protein [Labilibaculum sp. K2S]MDM8160651.1 cytidylate kinase family protein [Labilibaculum sp. K2S]